MRRKTKFVPVYSPKVVKLMLEEGYEINHTIRSVVNPYVKIYYFKFVPGIRNVINRFRWEVQNAER